MTDDAPPGVPPLQVNDLPPNEAVHRLIEYAATLHASDLFFAADETHIAVSVRHLGMLRPLCLLPAELGKRCQAHLKAVAGMDVAEKRRPHDGRHLYQLNNSSFLDMRINTLPTLYGEDLTLRLLERDSRLLRPDQLGLLRHDYNRLLSMLQSPSGLILVSGSTGSGKTTTLYACLAYLRGSERKINTIEDPIEYALEGIRQSQVNLRLGVDFPELLRSVLRQSPDVIMIGEIRDALTAATAVQAANSGHLVLATIHAPVAAAAVESMLGLGVPAHFLASSLLGCMAQRLLRTLCPGCRKPYASSEPLPIFSEVETWLEADQGQLLYSAATCNKCLHTGYVGRTGVFEVLTVSSAIRRRIFALEPAQALRRQALEEGMIEFRQAALLKVAQGETTVEEVFRVVPSEYLGVQE